MTGQSKATRPAITFIMVTVMLDSAGIGIIMPMMPTLIEELAAVDISGAARWGGLLAVTYALVQFLFGPLIGNLSDRFGRRPVLLFSMGSMAIDYVIMALAPSLFILFIGRLLAGIAGATISTANAFMADISSPGERAARFGLVGAAFGMGFVLGPMIGGLLSEFGTRVPFWVAAAVAALNFAFGYFVLTETLAKKDRRPFQLHRANPVGALRALGKFQGITPFFVVVLLFSMAHWVYPSVWSYFTQLERGPAMSPAWSGFSLSAFGVASAVVQGLLLRRILAKLGSVKTILLGLGANVLGFLALSMTPGAAAIFLLIPLIALGVVMTPGLQGLMSNMVPADSQGELQGAITSIQSIAAVVSPLVMTQLFANFTDDTFGVFFPGAPFFVATCLVLASAIPLRSALGKRKQVEAAS